MESNFDRRQSEYWGKTNNIRPYDHPVVHAFARQRVQFIAKLIDEKKPAMALDVGCGDGFGMHYMRSIVKTVHGCDKSSRMLEMNPADDACLKQCDAYELPYEECQFDLVYSWELLHHIGNPVQVVREMARVARERVLICEPNCLNPAMALFGIIKPEERGLLRFTPSFPRKLMQRAGLEDVRNFTVGWFTPNRTPEWLAKMLLKLPFYVPVVGLYTITVGRKVMN